MNINMKLITLLATCIVIFFMSCASIHNNEDNVMLIKQSTVKEVLWDSVFAKTTTIIPLETNDMSLIRQITRIYCDSDKIFILDKTLKKLLIFDKTGLYVDCISKIGNGPSEYSGIMDFCLDTDKKQIIMLCDRPYKVIFFDYNGNFIKEKIMKNLYYNILYDDGLFVMNISGRSRNEKSGKKIIYFDSDFNEQDKYIDINKNIVSSYKIGGRNLTKSLNNYYVEEYDYNIYQMTNSGIEIKYRVDFGKNAMPQIINKNRIDDELVKNAIEIDKVYGISDVVESADFLLFNTNNIGIYMYDKQKNDLSCYKVIGNSTLKNSDGLYYSVGSKKPIICTTIEPNRLIRVKELAQQYPDKFNNYPLLELANQVNEDDNPILILYEFKD